MQHIKALQCSQLCNGSIIFVNSRLLSLNDKNSTVVRSAVHRYEKQGMTSP